MAKVISYRNMFKAFEGKDILAMMTEYPVFADKLNNETIENMGYYPDEEDGIFFVTKQDIDDYNIPYDAVDWHCGETTDDDFFNDIIKKANHYLVFAANCTWNGSDGYKIVNEFTDAFYRSYDVSIVARNISKNGKTILFTEYSHDVPTGASTAIIALTDKEYNDLYYSEFKKSKEFCRKALFKIDLSATLEAL